MKKTNRIGVYGRRIAAVVLAVVMMCAMMPAAGFAVYAEESNDIADIYSVQGRGSLEYYKTTYDGTEKEPAVIIEGLTEGADFEVSYSCNKEPGYAKVSISGTGSYTGTFETYFLIEKASDQQADRLFGKDTRLRYYGSDRYATSIEVANALRKAYNITQFDNIVVACGGNYPDALSGGYLAKVKNAPIITVDKAHEKSVTDYISSNLKEGGTVYILGGTAAVSADFEKAVHDIGIDPEAETQEEGTFKVERLAGINRYETNIKILEASGVTKEAILVCSGEGYADSLSASAVGLPILLTPASLGAAQTDFLKSIESDSCYIIGGTGAVSAAVENGLKAQKNSNDTNYTETRVWGADRYATSRRIAETFFEDEGYNVVIAYGMNFPDGLSGGPLAMAIGAPLILTTSSNTKEAKAYVGSTWIKRCVTLGGPGLISNAAVSAIMTY